MSIQPGHNGVHAEVMPAYTVCYRCRKRKIRCGRERPQCLNCADSGNECDWSGKGKKPNQSSMLLNSVSDISSRLHRLEDIVSDMAEILERLNTTILSQTADPDAFGPPHHGDTRQTDTCSRETLSLACDFATDGQLLHCGTAMEQQDGLACTSGTRYPLVSQFPTSCQGGRSEARDPNSLASSSSSTDASLGTPWYPAGDGHILPSAITPTTTLLWDCLDTNRQGLPPLADRPTSRLGPALPETHSSEFL